MSFSRCLFGLLSLVLALAPCLPAAPIAIAAVPVPEEMTVAGDPLSAAPAPPGAASGPTLTASPSGLLGEAARTGAYPIQLAGVTGAVRPDAHGPQRNDPAEGIPVHAYSPFDERANREHPCPPGGCDALAGRVVVKLSPATAAVRAAAPAGTDLTGIAALDSALAAQGVAGLEPVFPAAAPPLAGATVATPDGAELPEPDLTLWYRAALSDPAADPFAAAQTLSETPGIALAEPDYVRKPVGERVSRGAGELGSRGAEELGSRGAISNEPLVIGHPPSAISYPPSAISYPPSAISHLLSAVRNPQSFTDPLYAQQWHLTATKVPEAWAYLQSQGLPPGGSRDVVVAVIDTGVDMAHPDLAANIWTNSLEVAGNGVDDDGNGYVDDVHGADVITNSGNPMDDHGHGTHVAGIIAAQANNGAGGVGVAYNSLVMPIKAAQYSGVLASSDIAEAVYYAVAQGADVINMSFGGYARSTVEEDALAVAFGQAVLVAAAGNDGFHNEGPCMWPLPPRPMYPASYNWVLGVMASEADNFLARFSNYDCIAKNAIEYELMAPGVDIWSTLPQSQYAAWDGTSMAAPVVSGIAALARTKWSNPDVYSSRFIMGQIAANAGSGGNGKPLADAQAALAVAPKPELRYLQHWLFDTTAQAVGNDDDGIVDAGETIDLAIVIRNHWGKADPVTVKLEAWADGAYQPDPYVTMITDTVDYGAIGSFNWDDNGLIYDAEGVITGVQHPFRFRVDPNTPNDHILPFRLTIIAGNGYDPAAAPLTFVSRFYLVVQRGRELPTLVTEDMVLSKDYYWIIPGPTLIEIGVAVTVTEGTQVQFGTPTPSDPYGQSSDPFLQVEGTLQTWGTFEEPIELFGNQLFSKRQVQIRNYGVTNLYYTKIADPIVGYSNTGYSVFNAPLNSMEHIYTSTDRPMYALGDQWTVSGNQLLSSVIHKMQGAGQDSTCPQIRGPVTINTVLFDSPDPWPQSYYQWYIGGSGTYAQGPMMHSVILQRQNKRVKTVTLGQPTAHNNAFLSPLWDPDINSWMLFQVNDYRGTVVDFTQNYWGTTSPTLIDSMIRDYKDDFNLGEIRYQPVITIPNTTTYPFVVDVVLSTTADPHATTVGAEQVTFTVTFNRDMDQTVQPQVSFGPDVPMTDYTIHPVDGGWQNARTWVGAFNVTPITGDGYQLIRVAGARAADDPWLVTGDDAGRFRFEIITSGTEAMNLQATGGEGTVDLAWTQNDFDLLSGFNLYRATSQAGEYTRVNGAIIPPATRSYRDTNVAPGQPYFYKFTVVKSDMSESDFSNVATATPLDTIAPAISHTPVTSAPPGLPLSLYADVTDNVVVQDVILHYRRIGATPYASQAMVHTTGNRYSATIEGAQIVSPGIEYYIEATDGVSTVSSGRAGFPWQVTVVDRPVVTAVSPVKGPASGGTSVTIAGSNFKSGATVTFGAAAAGQVVVVSKTQITCKTPAHFPAVVDVTVRNPDAQTGALLRGFTFESDTVSAALPNTGGGQHDIVQVPVALSNVAGLAAADVTITFNSAVLSARTARTGSLTPGWSLETNTDTVGQVRLSLASPGGTSAGSGVLALVEFEVLGAPGTNSALHFAALSLNDGAIPVQTSDGSFAVSLVYHVAGTVRYWNGAAAVPRVTLTLAGDRVYTAQSGTTGAYDVAGAAAGGYTLTPAKSDDTAGITAYDASLALRHAAGLATLTGRAATAADVDRSGAITSMDAFYILQKAVDLIPLPFPGAGAVWLFDSATRSFPNLNANQTGQDFTAILPGDPSGNWAVTVAGAGATPSPVYSRGRVGVGASFSPPTAADGHILPVSLREGGGLLRVLGGPVDSTGTVTATIWMDAAGAPVYSLDLVLAYPPELVSALSVQPGSLASDFSVASNLGKAGLVRIALAGSQPLSGQGPVARIAFRLASSAGRSAELAFERGDVNEGSIPVELIGGRISGGHVYFPLALRQP